jgi:hypothetical protein
VNFLEKQPARRHQKHGVTAWLAFAAIYNTSNVTSADQTTRPSSRLKAVIHCDIFVDHRDYKKSASHWRHVREALLLRPSNCKLQVTAKP